MNFSKWFSTLFKRSTANEPDREQSVLRKLSPEELQQRAQILKYPTVRMTQQEFDRLPNGANVTEEFLYSCPFNTWFVCRPSDLVPEVIVVGHVVEGKDLICQQYGGGLCVPARGINRYLLQLVPQ